MEFFRYAFLFFFGGTCGWVVELFFRRFVSQKKWVNPGFLTGPFLPLYGFGVMGFYLFSSFPWQSWISIEWLSYVVEIISIGALLTLIEYIAGLIFIKGMRIKLWDYTKRWGNIQGIICPAFSLIWTAVGALYVFLLSKPFITISTYVIDSSRILATSTIIGACLGIIVIDASYSVGLVTKIRKSVADSQLVVDWDKIKISFQEYTKGMQKKMSWALPFYTKFGDFKTMMNDYVTKLRSSNSAWQIKLEEKEAVRLKKAQDKQVREEEKTKEIMARRATKKAVRQEMHDKKMDAMVEKAKAKNKENDK